MKTRTIQQILDAAPAGHSLQINPPHIHILMTGIARCAIDKAGIIHAVYTDGTKKEQKASAKLLATAEGELSIFAIASELSN